MFHKIALMALFEMRTNQQIFILRLDSGKLSSIVIVCNVYANPSCMV